MRRVLLAIPIVMLSAGAVFADWKAGVAAYDKGDYTAALAEFQGVLAKSPGFAGAHLMAGKTLEKLGRSADALASFQAAARLEPGNPRYAYYAANALLDAGRAGEARSVLEKVELGSLPGKTKSTLLLVGARAALALDDTAGAIEAAGRAAEADPASAQAHQFLGFALSRDGRDREAFDAYRRAWSAGGDAAAGRGAVISGGAAARSVAGRDERLELYTQVAAVAAELAGKTGEADDALLAAEASLGAQRFDGALAWLDKSGLDTALVGFYKGQCLLGSDAAKAEVQLRRALAKDPEPRLRKRIYASLGYALDVQKRYDDAAEAYRSAGDAAKAAEMKERREKARQNAAADEEQRRIDELNRLLHDYDNLVRPGPPPPVPTPKT